MADVDALARDERVLGMPVRTAIIALLLVRVVVVAVLIWRADAVVDEGILRYERVASSPVTPYRNFAVEWMPIQAAVVQAIGGHGAETTATLVAVLAVVADTGVAAALIWGWGVRVAATYLLLGLPLLAVAYTRLDVLAVAFATWAFALGRRSRDGPAGATLGLAVLSGLWAAFLLPWAVLRRRRPTLVWAIACLALGGAAWYVVGGPKAPIQVLSFRGATGWDVQGTVGALLDAFSGGATFLEGGILRIGYAPAWARAVLLLVILGAAALAWFRWQRDRGDPTTRTVLAIAAAILALSPTYPVAWTSILVPWTALAWEEDRPLAVGTTAAIALTGVLVIVSPADETAALTTAIVLVRQLVLFVVAAGCFAPRRGT